MATCCNHRLHSKYKKAVSTGMVLIYLAVIVSVPANSASYLNDETKFTVSYYLFATL